MNLFAESFARWLADFYLLATMLLVVTLAVSWIIAQPARRVAVTRATLAGLTLLAALCALPGWSVVHLMTRDADDIPVAIATPVVSTEVVAVETIPVVAPVEPTKLPAMPELASVPAKSASESPAVDQFSTVQVVTFAFLIGTILVFAWQLVGHWRARVLMQGATNAPSELQQMLNELRRVAGGAAKRSPQEASSPQILISPALPTAVALGILRPTILLPQKLVESSDLIALRTILAHELAHIRHGDLRLLALCRALFVLSWANPLFWLLRRQLRLDQETLADAAAAEVSNRHQYAEQLIDWAKRFATDRPPVLAAAVGLWESPSQLRRRIAVLLDERLTIWRECTRRWRIASLAVCAGVAVGLSLVTLEPGLAEPEKGDEKPIAAAPEAEVEVGAKEYLAPIFISGRTLDRDGNRVAGATVYLASQRPRYRRIAETKSDERGYYEFKDVKLPIARADTNRGSDSGGFEVFGTADGYALTWRERKGFLPNKLHYRNVPGDPTRERPTAYGAADPIVLDLTFGPPATFRGRVVDDKGQPIPNTVLDIRYADSEWDREDYNSMSYRGALSSLNEREIVPRNLKTRKSDADGQFEFTGLPFDHRFSIWIHPPGFPTKRIWVVSNATIDAKAKGNRVYSFNQEIVLEHATPRNVPIQVVFEDTGEPAPKVYVSAGGSSATTNIDGRAMLRIPDGEHSLHLLQRIGTPYRATETSLTVSEDSVQQPTRAELQPAAVLEITVVDADTGDPLPGVDVWREEPNVGGARPYRPVHGYRSWEVETRISHYEQPRTGNDGKARVLFAPGTHRIGIAKEAYPPGYTPVERDGVELDLEAGEPVEVEFEMRRIGASSTDLRNSIPVSTEKLTAEESAEIAALIDILRETEGIGDLRHMVQRVGRIHVADDWATAIRGLTEIGQPAVPALITALDEENRDHAMSKLAFTLRAIGDPRAVPALIRALPRTLLPGRSDFGLRMADPTLLAFMQEHDISSRRGGDNFSYNRAFREVVGALHKLTGSDQRDMELNWVNLDGTEKQQKVKRQLFHRLARRWEDWWSRNWNRFKIEEKYATVNLPEHSSARTIDTERFQSPLTGATLGLVGQRSGKIVPSVHESKNRCFVDLDTERESGWPDSLPPIEKIGADSEKVLEWAKHEGIDMMGITYQPPGYDAPLYCLRPIDMKVWRITPEEQLDLPRAIRGEIPYPLDRPVELMIPDLEEYEGPQKNELGGTAFLFLTREGTSGLLRMTAQVTDTNVQTGRPSSPDDLYRPVGFYKGAKIWLGFIAESNDSTANAFTPKENYKGSDN